MFSTDFAGQTLSNAIGVGMVGWLLDRTGVGVPGLLLGMAALTAVFAVAWGAWVVVRGRPDTT